VTEQKEYYGPEPWQTEPKKEDVILAAMVMQQKLTEPHGILDGINSPDWPDNVPFLWQQVLATINEGVKE